MQCTNRKAPPGDKPGGASEIRFGGQPKTFPEHSDEPQYGQGSRQTGEITDAVVLVGAEQRIERLLHRFPRLNPGARIDARREIVALAALIEGLNAEGRAA